MILGAPVMPLITLRLPRRVTLVLALAVYAVAHVGSALTDSFAVLLAARFVAAVATGSFWALAAVAATALVGRQRRSTALGVVLGGGMLANVVGVPLGAVCGQVVGWRSPCSGPWLRSRHSRPSPWREGCPPSPATGALGRCARLSALRSGRLWLVLAVCVAVNAGVLSVYSFISPLLTARAGLPVSLVPAALVLFGVGAFVGNVLGGRVGDARPFATLTVTAAASLAACVLPGATLTGLPPACCSSPAWDWPACRPTRSSWCWPCGTAATVRRCRARWPRPCSISAPPSALPSPAPCSTPRSARSPARRRCRLRRPGVRADRSAQGCRRPGDRGTQRTSIERRAR